MKGARAKALVLKCSIEMLKKEPLQFNHGITRTEMKDKFPLYMGFKLSTYGNRMRDLVKDGLMGRHDMPNHRGREKRHFFPLTLHEEGLVNHCNCMNCEVPVVE